jgi:hypothetical protein
VETTETTRGAVVSTGGMPWNVTVFFVGSMKKSSRMALMLVAVID